MSEHSVTSYTSSRAADSNHAGSSWYWISGFLPFKAVKQDGTKLYIPHVWNLKHATFSDWHTKTEIDATSVQALTGLYVQFRHTALLVRKGFKDTVRMKSESGIYIRGAFVKRHPVCYVGRIPTIFRTSHGVATGWRSCGTEEKKSHKINWSR